MELYLNLPNPMKSMTREELEQFFPDEWVMKKNNKGELVSTRTYTKSLLMRTIIMNEKRNNRYPEQRTLRGLWYKVVKPVLDKMGLLQESDMTESGLQRWDATLSRYMADLYRRGECTYKDLGITDISRQRSLPRILKFNVDSDTFVYPATFSADNYNVIVATEKDSAYALVNTIAKLLGCSSISTGGQNALGAAADLIPTIVRRMRREGDIKTIHLLVMSDYDPSGYYIAEALNNQIEDVLLAIGAYQIDVQYHRVGITPDQLSEEEVENNKYTPKPANMEKWMQRTGGIDGEEKGLELDALESGYLRRIFVESLRKLLPETDAEEINRYFRNAYLRMKFLESVQSRVETMYSEFVVAFQEQVHQKKDIDLYEMAVDGHGSVDAEDHFEIDINSNDYDLALDEFYSQFNL